MMKHQGRRPFRWNNWFFKYLTYLPYKQTDVKVKRCHLEREFCTKRISQKRDMKVMIKLKYGEITSVGCHIALPPQVKVVRVFVVKMVWTGR